ncbi:MAG: amidase family protein, partial [Myxococcota bacterium]
MSLPDSILDLSLPALAQALAERRVSAEELTNHALSASRLDAYRTVEPSRSLGMARLADEAFAQGTRMGPLQGIPVSVKDLYGVPGFPTFAGTPERFPERFERAGPLVRTLAEQLGVVTGKTHTVELAFGGLGTNP